MEEAAPGRRCHLPSPRRALSPRMSKLPSHFLHVCSEQQNGEAGNLLKFWGKIRSISKASQVADARHQPESRSAAQTQRTVAHPWQRP